jgi:hypothetical protein
MALKFNIEELRYKISSISHTLYSSLDVNMDMLVAHYTFKNISKETACSLVNKFAIPENVPIKDISENSVAILYGQVFVVRKANTYLYCIPDYQLN